MKKILTIIILIFIIVVGLFRWKTQKTAIRTIQLGDKVQISMTSQLLNNEIYEQKEIIFTVGQNETLPAIEKNIVWMKKGETKTFFAESQDAYGINYNTNKIQTINTEIFSGTELPITGETLKLGIIEWLVTAINETGIILDLNDPITYQDMDITIEVMEIE